MSSILRRCSASCGTRAAQTTGSIGTPEALPLRSAVATTLVEVAGMPDARCTSRCPTPDQMSHVAFLDRSGLEDLVPAADIHYVRKSNPCMQFANFRQTKPV